MTGSRSRHHFNQGADATSESRKPGGCKGRLSAVPNSVLYKLLIDLHRTRTIDEAYVMDSFFWMDFAPQVRTGLTTTRPRKKST